MQGITNEWQLWWFEAVKVDRMILLSGGISGYLIPPHPAHYKGIQLDILWWRSVVSECTSLVSGVWLAILAMLASLRPLTLSRVQCGGDNRRGCFTHHPLNWPKCFSNTTLKTDISDGICLKVKRGWNIYPWIFLSIKLSIIRMQIFYSLKKTQLKS